MPVTLVTDPADVIMDPGVLPWTHRLKYAKPAELLSDYQRSNGDLGRLICPVTDYVAAHLDDDILDVEAHIYAHPEWGPQLICESLVRTVMFNNQANHPHGDFIAGWAQHYLLLHLAKHHTYAAARGPFEQALRHWQLKFMSPAAAYVALAYFNAGHPNPKRFLGKPEIAAKFPPIDLARYAAPDFPT
jgi:hypothetical protein